MTLKEDMIKKLNILIQLRDLRSGEKIPSEQQLCRRFKVSRHTIRDAIRNLVQDGTLYRIQGKGTFVVHKKVKVNMQEKFDFFRIAYASGYNPVFKILDIYDCHSTEIPAVAENLKIYNGRIWCVELLRIMDETPLIYSKSYLPVELFTDLDKVLHSDESFYKLIKEKYSLNNIEKQTYTLESKLPERHEMLTLQISNSIPVFVLKSCTKSDSRGIIEYRKSVSRSDMIAFTNLIFNRVLS